MDAWTEILSEDFGVTHVEGRQVLWSIGDVSEYHVRDVMDALKQRSIQREVSQQFIEESRRMRETVERNKHARQQLEAAGYDPEDIPI